MTRNDTGHQHLPAAHDNLLTLSDYTIARVQAWAVGGLHSERYLARETLAAAYSRAVALLPFPDELLKTNEREWLIRNTVRTHGRYTPDVATDASNARWHGRETN